MNKGALDSWREKETNSCLAYSGMVAHICHLSTLEAEVRLPQIHGQSHTLTKV